MCQWLSTTMCPCLQARVPAIAPCPAQAFDFSVAESSPQQIARRSGTCWCSQSLHARETGHLWWKTLSDPYLTLEVWFLLD